ncbi:putative redox protein [Arcticibacter tournemirensis]|uniref:OsmC family peroxiredoxin n=1 Tax=Arcticibacter tournemirensis TaxID=699437 RepID=A0A4Q0M851_9SPHI|nr:OsmC family protein [Arcticibacter tournemirensis]KAA8482060.1 OsmC family protein [Arcticibacter tournemirensis]RXF69318.1 OsmC family peroxiredoxin [Arcticibacter tournemirensis]TQM49472.1 putative redox protein [Arcticibacter tournemirensis]
MKIELNRINEAVHFEAAGSGSINVHIEGSPELGGEGQGVRPMELVLMALGSCSALDLIQILKKQRQEIQDFSVSVEGERADAIPAVFTKIHMKFKLSGNVDQAKAEKAAELAVKKYCSVHDMLAAGGVEINYEIAVSS